MSGGGDSGGTKTTIVEPPAYAVPHLKYALTQGKKLASTPYQAYTGKELAGFDPNQIYGMNIAQNRALNGDPNIARSNRLVENTLNNQYLGQGAYNNRMAGVDNKYLQGVINNSNNDITRSFKNATAPQTDANFARAGAFGGSAWRNSTAENDRQLASELAKNTSNLRYQDFDQQRNLAENFANRQTEVYQNERNRQMQSVQDALQLGNQRYVDSEALMKIGQAKQEQQQKGLNLAYDKFNEKNNYQTQQLESFSNLLAKLMGNTGNTSLSKGGGRSQWADAAGTAATLAGLYSKFAG